MPKILVCPICLKDNHTILENFISEGAFSIGCNECGYFVVDWSREKVISLWNKGFEKEKEWVKYLKVLLKVTFLKHLT